MTRNYQGILKMLGNQGEKYPPENKTLKSVQTCTSDRGRKSYISGWTYDERKCIYTHVSNTLIIAAELNLFLFL